MPRWVVMAVMLGVVLAVCAASVQALVEGASNTALQPQSEASGVDAAAAEAATELDDSVESASRELAPSADALDEVEREWLSPQEAAFLDLTDADAAADAEDEADDAEFEDEAEADADAEEQAMNGVSELELGTSAEAEAEKGKHKHKHKNDKKKKKKSGYVVPCDFSAKRGICLFGGKKVIVPDAVPKGLVAHYTFNDHHALDSSRHGNHGTRKTVAAPGRGGAGFSASFNGKNKLEIPHSKSLGALNEFSVSFWLFFPETLDPKLPRDCPIISKGTAKDSKLFAFSVDGSARSLIFHSLSHGGKVTSRGRIGPNRWTHVTLVRSSNTLSLYLHGVLDHTEQSHGGLQEPPSPLYIGRVPWSDKSCRVPFLIDDLRIYSRPLARMEIEAESFPSLGAIEPSYAHLGCLGCGYGDAVGSCRSGYHLCSQTELNAGGYQVARAMGWGDAHTQIWANSGNSNPPAGARLAMCCGGL